VWIAVWAVLALVVANDIVLATPWAVLAALFAKLTEAGFYLIVLHSLGKVVLGFLLGTVAAVALGIAGARFRLIRELFAPVMLVVKSVPVASFIILALIWIRPPNLSIFVGFLIVLPIIYAGVAEGISSTDRRLLQMGQVFQLSHSRVLRYIYVPQVLPFFTGASSVALGLCWKAGIAAEIISLPYYSIGEQLYTAKLYLDIPDVFAWTFVVIGLSLAFERFFMALLGIAVRRLEGTRR
jgi:NitT/TauT family transport system permease protein